MGSYYEQTGGTITKYYYAGAQRVAMRVNGTLSFLLTDHLGSTSVTTNANGNRVSEMRYTAWGEVRYTSGTTPTHYTFTGQYSNMTDFGLMFYNARWPRSVPETQRRGYDPALGRFAQADSLVPPGVQGYDRYAYVNNDPVRYTDPTGHMAYNGEGGDYTWEDQANDAYVTQHDEQAKCDAGNRTYCSYAEEHPVETATFVFGNLVTIGSIDYFLFGGGLTGSTTISLLAKAGTHNVESSIVSLGSYDSLGEAGYIQVAQALNNQYTYFKLPQLIYKIAEALGISEAVNTKFMYSQMEAGKDFAITILNNRIGRGTAMEISMLQQNNQYIQTTINQVFQYFQHLP